MIKNGLAEGMVTRKLCVEVLDLVLTSFQTSFFSAPTVSKVQITDMLLLSTSFFSYPLPRSHRQGGFEKQMFPSTSYSFLFQIKAAAHINNNGSQYHRNHTCTTVDSTSSGLAASKLSTPRNFCRANWQDSELDSGCVFSPSKMPVEI